MEVERGDHPAEPPQPYGVTIAQSAATAGRKGGIITAALSRLVVIVVAKGPWYWIVAALILGASFWLSARLYEHFPLFSHYHDRIFDLLRAVGSERPYSKFTRLVLIGQDEFESAAGLHQRVPTDRKYLAMLVSELANERMHANVIAIDFDLRQRDPDTNTVLEEHREETCELIHTIHAAVGRGSKVILATPIDVAKRMRLWDAYQAFGLCTRDGRPINAKGEDVVRVKCDPKYDTTFTDREREMIHCGYVQLRKDKHEIPLQLMTDDGIILDSFALAIARAADPNRTDALLRGRTSRILTPFLWPKEFPQNNTISAGDLRREKLLRDHSDQSNGRTISIDRSDQINGRTVIIGGNWREPGKSLTRPWPVDGHDVSGRRMTGALILANYVESLFLDLPLYAPPKWMPIASEIVFAVMAALVFAAYPGWWGLGALLPLIVMMFLLAWILLHVFGIAFDVLLPLLGLGLHSFAENTSVGHRIEVAIVGCYSRVRTHVRSWKA